MALVNDRWYCTLDVLKSELGETTTANDARLSRYIAQASRAIEDETGRTFIPVTATRYFDVPADGVKLFLQDDDLLSITTLSDDTGTITSTYYWLYPLNLFPKHTILLDSEDLGRAFEYDEEPNKAIAIAGQWGCCNDYVSPGVTLSANVSSTSATAVALSATVEVGWTLLVDTEAMFVSAVRGTTATVQRGANGTTAATHTSGATVYRYLVPQEIELACMELASYINNTRNAGGIEQERIGEYSITYDNARRAYPPSVAKVIKRWQRIV